MDNLLSVLSPSYTNILSPALTPSYVASLYYNINTISVMLHGLPTLPIIIKLH